MKTVDMNKTDRIIVLLGKQIVNGKYMQGEPLPSEMDFCEEFETSRNIIREVLRALESKRLIEFKRYRGAFVVMSNKWNYLDADVLEWVLECGHDPRLIMAMGDVRHLVEPAIARWAAERATPTDLVAIEAALNDMAKHHLERYAFNEADIRYHEAVLEAVHNPLLQQLGVAIRSLQRVVFDKTFMSDDENMNLTLQQHQDLYDAIRRQDPDMAEKCAMSMIGSTAKRLKMIT